MLKQYTKLDFFLQDNIISYLPVNINININIYYYNIYINKHYREKIHKTIVIKENHCFSSIKMSNKENRLFCNQQSRINSRFCNHCIKVYFNI